MNVTFPTRWACACLLAFAPQHSLAEALTITMLDQGQVLELVTRAVLTDAYGRLDMSPRFKEVPAARALAESGSGLVDGELHRIAGLSTKYPKLLQVNVPVNWFDAVVVSRSARFAPSGWDSLRPYTIGYHRGIQAFERGTVGMKVDPAPTNELMLRKLQNGRTDIALMSDVEARELLAKMQAGGLQILAPPIARIQLYHYVNKKHARLVPQLEAVLKRMAADGTIAAIRERTLINAGLKK
jgi:polar amino acid transport system substrate-binding protein